MAKGDCNRIRDVSPKYSSPPAQGRIWTALIQKIQEKKKKENDL